MPVVLYILASAVFAQATSEFMLAGLVAEIARDLDVSVAAAGSLTSAFAVGMVVGAPLMALAARRVPPRTALSVLLVVFVGVHVVGALTPDFGVLVVTRVLAALANAGFLATAFAVVLRVVAPERTARATAVLLAGTTLALIVGVPAGALLGQLLGWRSTFWAVALLSLPALVGVLAGVPAGSGARGPVSGLRRELAAVRRRPVVLTLLLGALLNGATFAVHTYVAPLLTVAGGLDAGTVPVGLALFGVGAFAGVSLAARFADAHYRRLLTAGGGAVLLGWVLLAALAGHGRVTLVLLGVMGVPAFAVGSAVIARALTLASDAPTMGGSVTTAAFNVGATAGPLVGGWSLAASAAGPAWAAAALTALAVLPAAATLHGPELPKLTRSAR